MRRWVLPFASLAITLGLSLPSRAWAGPPWASDDESFVGAHLDQPDFPSELKLQKPDMSQGCGLESAKARGCVYESHNVWINERQDDAVGMLHDLRWVFPDSQSADAFLTAARDELREGLDPVSQPPQVGDESYLFFVNGDYMGTGIEVTMYNLVFRVDNVVVKIFVSQGAEVQDRKLLTPLLMASLGGKAIARIKSTEPSTGSTTPIAPVTEPEPTPPSEPDPDPVTEPEPEPGPEPKPKREPREKKDRDRGRLAQDIRSYWRDGKLDEPVFFVGGAYASSMGLAEFTLDQRPLDERYQFDIAVGAMLHPRAYLQFNYHRDLWGQDDILDVVFNRVEFDLMVDLIAMPNYWRVRPALMAMVGFGLGWGNVDATGDGIDPVTGAMVTVREDGGVGIGGVFGGEFALHVRVAERFEIAPLAGISIPAYAVSSDHPYGERRIDGERGFGRAWRWNVGAKIGFSIN